MGNHRLRHVEIGYDTLPHRLYRFDSCRRFSDHGLGLLPNGQYLLPATPDRFSDGNDRGLVDDDPFSLHIDDDIYRAQVDPDITAKKSRK
jgi:hypothetical protein